MFNFKNSNSGKVRVKLIATLLVLTLTFANFALVGSYIGESIAAEINLSNQGTETNSNNVKFDVYLDEVDRSVKEKAADINSQEMNLYVSVSVQGEGVLNNAVIELVDTNFEFEKNPKATKVKLDSIEAEKGISQSYSIIAKDDEKYNLALLDMQSKIRLTGEYVDAEGNVTDIDTLKAVKLTWKTDSITSEDIELNQSIITNKIYKIDETNNKRIIQMLVTSKVKDNKAPVESAEIIINNPITGAIPEKVEVSSYSSQATNGKTHLEFNDDVTSKWEYKADEGKTYIKTFNTADANVVSWENDCKDKYIITYVYNENDEITSFASDTKASMKIYGKTEKLEKETTFSPETLETTGEIVTLDSKVTNKIYKGNMYLGKETTYETKMNLNVSYNDIVGPIAIFDLGDKISESEEISYYKSTKINKEDALKVLGAEKGTIGIYDFTKTDDGELIKEIVLSEENKENIVGDYYVLNYENIEATKIAIAFISDGDEGTIEIINEKAIKADEASAIPNITTLTTNFNLGVVNSSNEGIIDTIIKKDENLLEPVLTFDISTNKKTLSTQVENELEITTELKAVDSSNKLFSNPIIKVELPKEITEASLENITPVLYDDELTLNQEKTKVETKENGNKELVIVLEGTQTKYNTSAQSATITANLKVKANPFIADKNVEIKAICINDAENEEDKETVESKENVKLISKSGLIIKNTIKVGENTVEKINESSIKANITQNATISSTIINNFEENLSNINIEGKVPSGVTLTGAIVSSTEGLTVSYSEDLKTWVEEITDYSKVKAFKISLAELANGDIVDLSYTVSANTENIETNTELTNNLTFNYEINEQEKQEKIAFILNVVKGEDDTQKPEEEQGETTNTEKISVQLISTIAGEEIANGAQINNGQLLRYKVKVINTSNETINNLNLKIGKQNGVFYDLVQCGYIFDETKDENGNPVYPEGKPVYNYDEVKDMEYKEAKLNKLEPGKSKVYEYQIVAYIGSGENANKFSNNILITADNMENVNLKDEKTIEEAKLALKLAYGSNEEVKIYSDSKFDLKVQVKNLLNEELKNANVKINLPQELDCDVNYQLFLPEDVILTKNQNEINLFFKEIKAKEIKNATIHIKTNDLPVNELNRDITLKATANIGLDEKTYLSNDLTKTMLQRETHITAALTSDKAEQILKHGDEITYTANIKNDGNIDVNNLSITDMLPGELDLIFTKVIDSNGKEKEISNIEEKLISVEENIKAGDSITVIVKAKVNLHDSSAKEISNGITITSGIIDQTITKNLTNKLISESTQEPEDPQKPEDPEKPQDPQKPEDPQKPQDPEKPTEGTYSISGLAWLDDNKNGIRDEKEEILKAVKVILLNTEKQQMTETVTSLTGTYKFSNLSKGEYLVIFDYDEEKYAVTKYQIKDADVEKNSDAISKQIKLNDKLITAGVTDTIKLENKDIVNIDIGLVENPKFDMSLNKYISKVVVTNNEGTKTYEYEDTNLAKVEIGAKHIAGTVLLVEYKIEVTNNGDVNGYVTDIIDYLPNELEFNSEMNAEWYLEQDKLHYMALDPQAIEPGKTQTIKLVLTKTLKSNSTGTIENIAEIGECVSLEGIKDSDSVSANKQESEDDLGKASLIVSIRTGSPVMYIGIVLASMIILGTGIYIIDKKVLKVRI